MERYIIVYYEDNNDDYDKAKAQAAFVLNLLVKHSLSETGMNSVIENAKCMWQHQLSEIQKFLPIPISKELQELLQSNRMFLELESSNQRKLHFATNLD